MNILRTILPLIGFFILLGIADSAEAQTCRGTGCEYISLTQRESDGCMVFVNRSNYRVTISTGAGGHAPTVHAGSSVVLQSLGYGCQKNLLGVYTATAHGVPPKPRQPKAQPSPSQRESSDSRRAPNPTPLREAEELPEQYKFYVTNSCHVPVWIYLYYKALSGKWVLAGKWTIQPDPFQRIRLGTFFISEPKVVTQNTIAYYYAVSEKKSDPHEWDGEKRRGSRYIQMNAGQKSFRKIEAEESKFEIDLTCTRHR